MRGVGPGGGEASVSHKPTKGADGSLGSGAVRRPRLTAVVALLAATGLAVRAALGSSPSPERLHSLIDEILSSPGYEVNPPLSWVIQRWVFTQLQRLLDAMSRLSDTGPLSGLPGKANL